MKSILQKMKCVVAFALVFSIINVSGNPVDEQKAKQIGARFLSNNTELAISSYQLHLAYQGVNERTQPCYYVFNVAPMGFVLVSADDCVKPILGYSTKGFFDITNIPPNMKGLMDNYQMQITDAVANNILPTEEIQKEWKTLLNDENQKTSRNTHEVTPLLTTTWNQDYPYNYFCPEDPAGPGGHSFAGCVATAMGQIMRYWSSPTSGTGSFSYQHPTYGVLSANFEEAYYDYFMMPDAISESSQQGQIEAVGTLLYHCGVSVEMDYSPTGSGAVTFKAAYALGMYFGYLGTQYVSREDYENDAWVGLLTTELDNNRPMIYNGFGPEGGHAFICDGYDANFLFHFNWGWSGMHDGYFELEQLNPGGSDFSQDQSAIINIEGPSIDCDAPLGVELNLNEETKVVTVTWNVVPDQEMPTYLVFRNGVQVKVTYETTFSENTTYFPNGRYCYSIKTICDNGHTSNFSSEACVTIGPEAVPSYHFEDLKIYPNPSNEKVMVEGNQIKNIVVFNMMGQIVENIDVINAKTVINTAKLEAGVYFMKLTTNDENTITKRFVVAH